jgi:iron only hydrogenase large subunit-like protein
LTDQGDLPGLRRKLDDLEILATAIVDPAAMESIGNEFPEINKPEQLNGLLKLLGFERIFNLESGLALYSESLASELKDKKNGKVLFNSNCVAFKRYVRKFYPELSGNISKTAIPEELIARLLKTEYAKKEKIDAKKIFIVAISSCAAKKAEKYDHLDAIITVRELGRMAREKKVALDGLKSEAFEKFGAGDYSGASNMIRSGGTAEAVINSIGKKKIKPAVANGVQEIKKVLDDIKTREVSYDFVEGTVCPGGCVGGGGQSLANK